MWRKRKVGHIPGGENLIEIYTKWPNVGFHKEILQSNYLNHDQRIRENYIWNEWYYNENNSTNTKSKERKRATEILKLNDEQ